MLDYAMLDEEQLKLIDRLYGFDISFIYATMGSGKTVCTLTAIDELLADGELKRILIVAPLKPCKEVWATEHQKWSHLEHLDVALAVGSAEKRKSAIESGAQIVVINIDNLVWFLDKYKKHDFDGLVLDELSKFKDNGAKVVKKLRYATKAFKWKVGLTGTPAHENWSGLFSQVLVLDGGERFGKRKDAFLQKYFYPTDWEQRNWDVRDGQHKSILGCIKDILYSMPDYTHTLPKVDTYKLEFQLTGKSKDMYKEMQKHSVIADGDLEIVADNAAVQSGKLEQLSSGWVYDTCDLKETKDVVTFGHDRFNTFKQFIESGNKAKYLIFYWFDEDRRLIREYLGDKCLDVKDKDAVSKWNSGELQYLIANPASAGHGLNLAQGGSSIIFYAPIWSNDMYKQAIGRLWRRGQTKDVSVVELVCTGTVDELKVLRVEDKDEQARLFDQHVKSLA